MTREFDTILGGKQVAIATNLSVFDTSRDRSFAEIPPDWAPLAGIVRPGLEMEVPATQGSLAIFRSFSSFASYDAAVEVEILSAPLTATGELELAALETEVGASAARVLVSRILETNVRGEVVTNGKIVVGSGGATKVSPVATKFVLRLVRDRNRVFGFVDNHKVIEYDMFPVEVGQFVLAVRNPGAAARIATKFKNFTMRSHAFISSRLLDSKVVRDRRIVGRVPRARVADVGQQDVTVFGLFGSVTAQGAFEYILPSRTELGDGAFVVRL